MMEFQSRAFSGPLDLLLQLIAKAKLDIQDIFLSDITEQYLLVVAEMDKLDMESASDFIGVAATLLYIKSRSLLPKPEEDVDAEEERRQMIRNLEEYKRLQEVSFQLVQMEETAAGYYYRMPDELVYGQPEIVLEQVGLKELVAAFEEVLKERGERAYVTRPVELLRRTGYSVIRKLTQIRNRLRERESIDFLELFSQGAQREEIVAAFLAVLELIFTGEAVVHQSVAFGRMVINRKQEGDPA